MKKQFKEPKLTSKKELTEALFNISKELDEKNKQLKEKNELLKANELAKMNMYTNLSHDLRSPIGAIRGAVEYLLKMDTYKKEDVDSALELIYNKSVVLEKLINDIFLLSRLDSSSIKLNKKVMDAYAFLEECYYMIECEGIYEKRNMILKNSSVNAYVNIDPDQMMRVFNNLVSNSHKYSNEGDTIELSMEEDDKNIIYYVKDTGIGISEEHIDKIFERTYTVSKARTPSDNSFGIGLAIVKGIVESHNGKVLCESEIKKGTVIKVIIPKYDKKECY